MDTTKLTEYRYELRLGRLWGCRPHHRYRLVRSWKERLSGAEPETRGGGRSFDGGSCTLGLACEGAFTHSLFTLGKFSRSIQSMY